MIGLVTLPCSVTCHDLSVGLLRLTKVTLIYPSQRRANPHVHLFNWLIDVHAGRVVTQCSHYPGAAGWWRAECEREGAAVLHRVAK